MSVPWDGTFLAKLDPLDYDELWKLLDIAFYRRKREDPPALRDPWAPDNSAPFCFCLIGEPGIGKSAIVRSWAQKHGFELRLIMMGQGAEEENMGIAKQEYDEKGHHKYSMPPWMPVDETEGGIAFIDEVGTGRDTHQNIIAHILTVGYTLGYFGHKIPKNWFFIAAMNPEDGEYLLNMNLDPRVQDRLAPVYLKPSAESIISFLGNNCKIPEKLHGFLLMNPENALAVSPRTWEFVGQVFARAEVCGIGLAHVLKFVRGKILTQNLKNDAIIEALRRYYKYGNDPLKYPLSPHKILHSDKETHAQNLKIIEKWVKKGEQPYISATAMGLVNYIKDDTQNGQLDENHWERIAEVCCAIGIADQMYNILAAARGTPGDRLAVKVCRKYPPLKEALKQLYTDYEKSKG